EYRVHLFYGMESAGEGSYLDELEQIAQRTPNLRVIAFPRDRRGFITPEAVAAETGDLDDVDVLICGPPAMTESLVPKFEAAGVPRARIHFEKFGFGPG